MIYPDGSQYEGDFLLDKIDGIGTFKWTNGKKYIG